ncbi:MAG: YbaN family protein [Candidatus Phaeomarinobacter sp.]
MSHNSLGIWDAAASAEAFLRTDDDQIDPAETDRLIKEAVKAEIERSWRHRSTRGLWNVLGAVFVLIGAIGVFLPLIPTTGPLLVAAWAFAMGSPRLHHWLINYRVLGPFIVEWETYGVIKPRAKLFALSSMGLASAWMMFGADIHWSLATLGVALCIIGSVYVASRPSSHEISR